MEIYKERVNQVEFEAPEADTTVTAEYSFNGSDNVVLPVTVSTAESEIRTVNLPYFPEEGEATVTWKFTLSGTDYAKTTKYRVVTPYVSPRWIKKNLMEGATDEEIKEAESSARFIINSHTGQSFGKETSTKTVIANGNSSLALPARLLSATTVNGVALPASYAIDGDGWYLSFERYGIPPLRADYYGIHETNGVIENPYGVKYLPFQANAVFEIAGTWGWDEVPEEITEAAKLLINDYASGDSLYRDRYLTSMTAADWRIQFNSGAFARTGNVRADHLLTEYVLKRGWAVI